MDLPDMDDQKMTLYDWFDDLCVRFIINLPHEELSSVERICFQVEEAQWFYEDFIRPLDPSLPSMNLRTFCLRFFDHCPIFANFTEHHYLAAFTEFLAYKSRVPVRGAILLNEAMDHVVLVKGWKKGAKWSFPRGKINLGEKDLDCAIREVYEETGFDVRKAGLVEDEAQTKFIEVSMREQHMRLYVFRGVKMDTHFEPRTRKEISKINWWKISELPTIRKQKQTHGSTHAAQIAQQITQQEDMAKSNMFYMVAPFLGPLKQWIRQKKKAEAVRAARANTRESEPADEVDDIPPSDNPPVAETEALPQVVEQAPFAANPGDMERIFAQLRQSQPNPQAYPAVIPSSDPAEALKKMLSIGGIHDAALPPPRQGNSRATDLLALFNREAQNGSVSIPPVTPFEQLSLAPNAQTPHLHNSHQHVFHNAAPPPQFHQPAPAVQHQMHRPEQVQPPMQHPARQGRRNPFIPDQVQRQLGALPPAGSSPPAQPTSQLPYRHTGEPQFTQFAGLHSLAVPSASDLPQPRLNNHTMALLNAFKGAPKLQNEPERYVTSHGASIAHPSAANHPPHSSPVPEPSSSTQQQALLNLFKAGPGAGKPPQRAQPAETVAIPSEPVELSAQPTPIVHQQRQAPPPPMIQTQALQQTKRQNRGITSATVSGPLNMPAFDTVRRSSSRHTSRQAKPVELASVQSPDSDQPGQFIGSGPIKILTRPGSSSTNQVAGQPPLDSTPPPMQPHPSRQISIEAPQPKAAHQQYLQILRPPRAHPSAPSSAQGMGSPPSNPSVSASGNGTPGAHEQKNMLLNLFMKHTAQTQGPGVHGGSITGQTPTLSPPQFQRESSSIISPISPHPTSMHAAIDPPSASRSRISSLASASGDTFLSTIPGNLPGAATAGLYGHPLHGMKPPPTSAGVRTDPTGVPAASRKSSTTAASSRQESAAEGWPPRGQSPVTPTDRNFLLGYLEGVVKGAGV